MELINTLLLLIFSTHINAQDKHEEPVLYYYGLEESEHSLPPCGPRQACSALLQRYWRAPALVRLCRCARRRRCDALAAPDTLIDLNNRAHLQFCQPITDWPECTINDTPLVVETSFDRMNPEELEELHHKNIQLTPPKIMFYCRCRNPNYWKINTTTESNTIHVYHCASLPLCKSGDFCGNVNNDLYALYQSCLCPKHHMCLHNGGVTHEHISELLYSGKGWKAFCTYMHINDDYIYEEY